MSQYLVDMGWTGADRKQLAKTDPCVMAYFVTCLKPALGEKLTTRNTREMTTVAEALYLIIRGDVTGGAEVLMQRFKSLETFAHHGSWEQARHLELVRPEMVSCISSREQELAVATELLDRKLSRRDQHRGGGVSPSPSR